MDATRASFARRVATALLVAFFAIAISLMGGGVSQARAVDTGGTDPTKVYTDGVDAGAKSWYAWTSGWYYITGVTISDATVLSYEWSGNTCNVSLHGAAQPGDTIKLDITAYARSGGTRVNGTSIGTSASMSTSIVLQDGTTTFTVQPYSGSRNGTTKTFNVTIDESTAKAVTGLEITTPPTKTAYHEGDAFDAAGMVVTARFDDGSSDAVKLDKLEVAPATLTADTTEVALTFRGITAKQPVTVATLVGIEVTTPPAKTEYFETQRFNPEGMVVTATYSDDTTAVIPNDACTLSPIVLAKGDSVITVTYQGKTAEQPITTGEVPPYIGLINRATSKGSLDMVTINHTDGTPFEDCVVTVDDTTVNVLVGRSEGLAPTLRANFTLTQTGGFPFLSTTNSWVNASNSRYKTTASTTTIANAAGSATVYLYDANPGIFSNNYTTVRVNYTLQNNAPAIIDGVAPVREENVSLGDTVDVDLTKVFADADGDALTYQVSVDGAAAQTIDSAYTYAADTHGVHTLTFTAKDFAATSATYTLAVNTKTNVTFYAPYNSTVKFYATSGFDADGTDALGDALNAVRSMGNGYRLFVVQVPADVSAISFRGTDSAGSLGGMSVAVPSDGSPVYLRAVDATVVADIDGSPVTTAQSAIAITYDGHAAIQGTSSNTDEGAVTRYLLVADDPSVSYTVTATPDESISVDYSTISREDEPIAKGQDVQKVVIKMMSLADIALDSDTFLFSLVVFNDDKLSVDPAYGACTYEVDAQSEGQLPEGVTLASDGTLSGVPAELGTYTVDVRIRNAAAPEGAVRPITIKVEDFYGYLGVKTEAKVYDDFENELWLNAQQVKLDVGETWELWPRRIQFIGNDSGLVHPAVIYPSFNIEKLRGDTVDLPAKTETHGYSNQNGNINYSGYVAKNADGTMANDVTYTVTGTHPGTTIVQVTYDAYDLSQYKKDVPDLTAYTPKGDFPATSEVNTGYIVFTVGEKGTAAITSSIDDWRHYDTVYFTEGETVPYDITVETVGATKVVVTCNGLAVEANADGTYTLPLENRDNIVGIIATDADGYTTSTYRVIAARYMEVEVANKTAPGEDLKPGDTATVTLKGVTLPINRVMGYYNPHYTATGYSNTPGGVSYTCAALGDGYFNARKGQWTLKDAWFEATFEEPGIYEFVGNNITLGWWGADLGSDLLQPKDYNPATTGSAPTQSGSFSQGMIPSFSVVVKGTQVPEVADTDLGSSFTGKAIEPVQLVQTGGGLEVSWALAEGSELPAGLSLSKDGVVSGTPRMAGSYSFQVVATNEVGASEPATVTLAVADKYAPASGTVYFTITDDHGFYVSDGDVSGVTMWRVPVDLAELAAIDLDDITLGDIPLGQFKYDEDGDGSYDVVALQLFYYASSLYYVGGSDSFTLISGPLPGRVFINHLFGSDASITYSLNDTAPLDPQISAEEGADMGKTCDRYVLKDGDEIVFHMQAYDAAGEMAPGHFFIEPGSDATANGNLIYEAEAVAGQPLDIQVKQAFMGMNDYGMVYLPYSGDTLKCSANEYDPAGASTLEDVAFDSNGAARVTFDEAGTYYLWTDDVSPAMLKVTVAEAGAMPDGTYSVGSISSENFGMAKVEDGAAAIAPTVVVKDGEAYLVMFTASERYDGLAFTSLESIDPNDTKQLVEGVEGITGHPVFKEGKDALDGYGKDAVAGYLFTMPLTVEQRVVLVNGESVTTDFIARYIKGYSEKYDGDWYVAKNQATLTFGPIEKVSDATDLPQAPADYHAVVAAIASAPEDLSVYTDESVAALEAAIAAADATKMADDQASVDAMAQAIADAVAGLVIDDAKVAAAAEAAIAALPAADDVTVADAEAIDAAAQALEALTDDQAALVSDEAKAKLAEDQEALAAAVEAAEKAAADAAAAKAVEDAIAALPAADDVTAADADAITAAEQALAALTDDQKAFVSDAATQKLAADREALDKALAASTIQRIAGAYTAADTAAAISAAAFPEGSEWVVVAREDDFADALGAVGLAGALDAPIVLTNRFELSESAAAEVTRLGAKHAYIIGGTGAIKTAVDDGLSALGVAVEPRIWGDDSYDTSLACAQAIEKVAGESADTAIVAMSINFADALSMSPYAYKYHVPIVLQTFGATAADRGLTDDAKAYLAGKRLLVAGGPGAISDASLAGLTVEQRIYGDTGYDTSQKIADWAVENGYLGSDAVVIACGAQAPKGVDALAGAALAGRLSAPMLLVNTNTEMEGANTATVDGFVTEHAGDIKQAYVLGGAYVAPQDLYDRVRDLIGAEDLSA